MVRCASGFSSPPKVCTNCIDQYINLKQTEHDTQMLTNISSLDNTTCASVIYGNYLVSYSWEISDAIQRRIWDQSRCDSCLKIHSDFQHRNSTFTYEDSTLNFDVKLKQWRGCINNVTEHSANTTDICENCMDHFNTLFKFYWQIYTAPERDFCVDVETTMNDTMNIWHNVWRCGDDFKPVDRHHDVTMLIFASVFLGVITFLFYAGSYIQAERAQRNIIQYSRMNPPSALRSRLLSSSTLADDFSSSSTTQGFRRAPIGH
uniref:Transmembrane protein n=1 Tax=Steinernema glaseri TaxID=37863 RepID=A0A1I7ZG33_9BILA